MSCSLAGETDTGSPGMGTVELYDNTLYNCGARADSGRRATPET